MPTINWTPEQQNAIFARGGSLLVSAAAGSGKTAVLSQRVIERIIDEENPVDIDKMLIVTFTRAAAEQMRDKISSKLAALLQLSNSTDPDLEKDGLKHVNFALLQRQQLLLTKAHISTIHAFCFELIRENAQKLGVAPDVFIGDARELDTLRDDALKTTVEEYYAGEKGSDFTELADLISSGRDDKNLFKTVYRLYDFIRSHPFYEDWLAEKLDDYNPQKELCKTEWGMILLEYASEVLNYCVTLCDEALEICEQNESMKSAYQGAYQTDREAVLSVLRLMQGSKAGKDLWDNIRAALPKDVTPFAGSVRGEKDNPQKQRADAIRKQIKTIFLKLRTRVFLSSQAEFADDIRYMRPKIELLFSLTLAFAKRLDEFKRERHMVDFSDLEQLTLRLLYDKKEDGGHEKSALAKKTSQSFAEIMLDEYQDTNEAQNMIFEAIAQCDEKTPLNLFLVGDVKQSIYRFRHAMPEIFLQKKDTFYPFDNIHYPAKINLGANFRSRSGITDSVNFVFHQLMQKALGELDYGDEEALLPRANYPKTNDIVTEIQIIDIAENTTEDAKEVLEARYVARRISEMLAEGYRVSDGEGGTRRAVQSDFCVLLRSKKDKLTTFVKELRAGGVNAWAETQGGYLAAREISLMLSFLRVIDNPLLDIPFTAILLSELFYFTLDEVAQLRLEGQKLPLYLCASKLAQQGDKKCINLVKAIKHYTSAAVTESIDRLILQIYRETDYLSVVSAMPMGETRRANLLLLAQYADEYNKNGHKGLGGFVRFVDRIVECGADFETASTMSENADVVRVMTIHHSKGLEFPIVFISDTAKQHNATDYIMEKTILHQKYGFACRRRDENTMKEYTTVPMEALKLECERDALSEELRVLYVAMTRAKEKLIVTMTQNNIPAKLKELAGGVGRCEKLPSYLVRRCKSFADWLLMCALRHPDAANLRGIAMLEDESVLSTKTRIIIEVSQPIASFDIVLNEKPKINSPVSLALLDAIEARIGFKYAHLAACSVPSKLGVSAITHGQSAKGSCFTRTPSFITEESLTGAQRGSALHQFMQFASYENASKNAAEELLRMAKLGFITEVQRACINTSAVSAFFKSSLYGRISASNNVRRELRFLAQLSAEELGFEGDLKGEEVTVQGVADCVFTEGDACVIVDYKTDAVKSTEELALRYTPQLVLYKKIIEESLHLQVKECILYSFALNKEVLLDI
ncbi:MAG: helicase-exonuclease AddAB subunit AddA [Hydrogenoanaerobacterium sp.]